MPGALGNEGLRDVRAHGRTDGSRQVNWVINGG